MKINLLLVIIFSFWVSHGWGAVTLRYSKLTDTEEATPYIKEILALVWDKTKDEGEVTLTSSEGEMSQERALQRLRLGKDIDLFWTMTSKEREKDLRVIRVPLLRGLLGYRLLIIHKNDQRYFDQLKNQVETASNEQQKKVLLLRELQKISMGQGHDWPDTKILENSGFKVVTSSHYRGLFSMLKSKRFMAFPRGLNEPWKEIDEFLGEDYVVEKNFCIAYPAPLYFMLSKKNEQLARRIEKGLRLAIADGSFEKVFKKHWEKYLIKAKMKDRLTLWISNPFLSEESKKSFEKSPIALKY